MKKKLDKSISEAVSFVRDNYKEIDDACGFPEISGRNRITEWGGTISGLHVIKPYITLDSHDQQIYDKSLTWITSKQDVSGGWDTGGIIISEATSEVLYYLLANHCNPAIYNQDLAIEFIKRNYKSQGYFISAEQSTEGRIYTTYLSVKALLKANIPIDKRTISSWVNSIRNGEMMWGESSLITERRIAHTIYALNILNLCGLSWAKIKQEYEGQIKWIFAQLYKNQEYYSFEEYSIPTTEKDGDGQKYKRIRIRHFNLPLAIHILLDTDNISKATILSDKLIRVQRKGGWGISETELTIWGTQQSLDALNRIKESALSKRFWRINFYLRKLGIYLKQNQPKFIVSFGILVLAVLGATLNFMPDVASGIIIGVIANSLTGYFTNWNNSI